MRQTTLPQLNKTISLFFYNYIVFYNSQLMQLTFKPTTFHRQYK